jgi:hypothetical protein
MVSYSLCSYEIREVRQSESGSKRASIRALGSITYLQSTVLQEELSVISKETPTDRRACRPWLSKENTPNEQLLFNG